MKRASKDKLSTGLYSGNREEKREVLLLLLLLSLISLGKGLRTSWGNGEAAPQGTSWHLQVKANKPVEHIEEEEGCWEKNSRVVVQAVDVNAEAAVLPGAALTIRDRAEILPETSLALTAAPGVQVVGILEDTCDGGLLGGARRAFLSITSLRGDNLTHKHFLLLAGMGAGTSSEAGMGTATKRRLKWTGGKVGDS